MTKSNTYILQNGNTSANIAAGVSAFLKNDNNMETQTITANDGGIVVQGRVNGGTWKRFIGMDKAISVKFTEANGMVQVEIGEGKWIDKGLVMALSMIVLWPLFVTSGVGMYQQAKLPEKIFDYISKNLL